MPSVARPHIWNTGEISHRFRKPNTNFKARPWSPPKDPRLNQKRTPSAVDADWRPTLRIQADEWAAEADRLQRLLDESGDDAPDPPKFLPIEVDLSTLLSRMEKMNLRIEHQIQEWDRTGDGTISKGEFRLHLKGIGLDYPPADIDELFEKYDTDRGGTIDLKELKSGFKRLKNATKSLVRGEEKLSEEQEKINALRARVAAARDAIQCANKADACDEQLGDLLRVYASRIDLQLGEFLVARGINLNEVVKTWPKPRGTHNASHQAEVSKEEFKDEITLLGLQVAAEPMPADGVGGFASARSARGGGGGGGTMSSRRHMRSGTTPRGTTPRGRTPRGGARGASAMGYMGFRPVRRKELGALFDEIDLDRSGWLSLKEMKEALKRWEEQAAEAVKEQAAKETEITDLRRRAARQLKAALRKKESEAPVPDLDLLPRLAPPPKEPRESQRDASQRSGGKRSNRNNNAGGGGRGGRKEGGKHKGTKKGGGGPKPKPPQHGPASDMPMHGPASDMAPAAARGPPDPVEPEIARVEPAALEAPPSEEQQVHGEAAA